MGTRKGIAPVLWVIIVALLLVGGYVVAQKSKSKTENAETVAEQAVAPTAQKDTQSPSTVPADWKTYRNEQYGFEFRYPSTYIFGADATVYPPSGGKRIIRENESGSVIFKTEEIPSVGLSFNGTLVVEKDNMQTDLLFDISIFDRTTFTNLYGVPNVESYIQKRISDSEKEYEMRGMVKRTLVDIGGTERLALQTRHEESTLSYFELNVFVEQEEWIIVINYDTPYIARQVPSINSVRGYEIIQKALITFRLF